MNDFPKFTDLREIAAELSTDPIYSRLGTAIERAARVQSCVSDLAEAETCIEALDEILGSMRRWGTMTRLATEAALLRTAVTLYERATAAGAKKGERGSIQVRDLLTPAQAIDHDALVAVRQRSLAHVYVGEELNGQVWHRDLLFAVEDQPGWRPGAASQRVQFDAQTFARLKRQVPVALELLKGRYQDRLGELEQVMNSNPVPSEVFERHQFNPVTAFGSDDAVRAVLAARTSGRGAFAA